MVPLLVPGSRMKSLVLTGLVLAVVLTGAPSFAGKSVPDENIPFSGKHVDFSIYEGRYVYQFSWNGIPSARSELMVTLDNEQKQPYYRFEGTARTSKFVDIFWRLRATVFALVDAVTGRTVKLKVVDKQNSKMQSTETVFNYDHSEAYYTRWKKGQKKQKTIHLKNGTIDPVSLCLFLQREMRVGDSVDLIMLVGDDSYKVKFSVAAQERITVAGSEVDALRIVPSFVKIADKGKNKPPKVHLMTMWVSVEKPRIPLKMRSKTFIGHVTAELVGIEPVEQNPAEQSAQS